MMQCYDVGMAASGTRALVFIDDITADRRTLKCTELYSLPRLNQMLQN